MSYTDEPYTPNQGSESAQTEDFELVIYSVPDELLDHERFCEIVCDKTNANLAEGYDGPSPYTLSMIDNYCSGNRLGWENYPPKEYDAAIRRNIIHILANWQINDHRLMDMLPMIDFDKFLKKISPTAVKLIQESHGKDWIATLLVQYQGAFIKEVSKQTGYSEDYLKDMVNNGKFPVEHNIHMPGVFINNSEVEIKMWYRYTRQLAAPTAPDRNRELFAWWREICEEAHELANERERELDYSSYDRWGNSYDDDRGLEME